MPYSVARKPNENPDQMLVRFNKLTNRFVKQHRRLQAFRRRDSRLKVRIGALKRESYRSSRRVRAFYS